MLSDYRLVILAVVFCTLSFVMCWIVRRLPLLCQLFWPIISVWGILWSHLGVYIAYPESRQFFWIYVIVFLSALPGMLWLHWQQATDLIYLIKKFNLSKRTSGIRILLQEDELENKDVSTHNPIKLVRCSDNPITIVLRRIAGFGRRDRV